MKAFLELQNGEYLDDFVYISKYPLEERGYEIVKFDPKINSLEELNPLKGDVLVGSVQCTQEFFKLINVNVPEYIGFPEELAAVGKLKEDLYSRCIWKSTINNLLSRYDCGFDVFPIFIKPLTHVKLFTGTIIESLKDLNSFLTLNKQIDKNSEIWCSEVIPNIISEYRIFVHSKPDGFIIKNKIVGAKNYLGDFTVSLNKDHWSDVQRIIESFHGPIAYSLDVGITKDGYLFLIEINDFWALGSYGLHGKLYTKLLISRFDEICRG